MITPRQNLPSLGVIIVNWNNPADTLHCLQALEQSRLHAQYLSSHESNQANFRLVVVDNGSQDDSLFQLQVATKTYPYLELLQSPENLGFTGGYNLGIRYLLDQTSQNPLDYLLLLNDDAVPDPNFLVEMAQTALSHPEAGFLGPKILCLEEPNVFLSAGGILEKDAQTRHRGLGEIDHGQYDQIEEMDFLSGCALWVNRKVIENVGLLDDRFFAYFEEVDWCYRARQAGSPASLTALFVPGGRVLHPDTRQRDRDSETVCYYLTRNNLYFAQKHQLGWLTISRLLWVYSRRWLSWSIRPKWRDKKFQRQALAQALVDFMQGRLGKRK